LEEENHLGMNITMKSSSRFKLSYLNYIYAYELEYSSCVMSIAYELEYSYYVMNLAFRTLCLTFHTIYMMRIRAELRWQFIVPSGVPMSYACRSVGSEIERDVGSFLVNGRGAQVLLVSINSTLVLDNHILITYTSSFIILGCHPRH
jgi:hypothetical protein